MLIGMENTIVLVGFLGLMVAISLTPTAFRKLRGKPWQDWCLDLTGLWVQGLLIPLLQMTVIYRLYHLLLSSYQGCWYLPLPVSFILSFVGVDYLYYWNHRLLHQPALWHWHQVHHTVTDMDVLGTSRNTLWTSFFIVYLWVHPLFIYLLDQPVGYLMGVSLTAALDLWRHSPFGPQGWLLRCCNSWLILPQDHAQHHANTNINGNYGANLKCWDHWHGTYQATAALPPKLGISIPHSLLKKLFYPLP